MVSSPLPILKRGTKLMPMEVAVVFNQNGMSHYWHCPSINTAYSIPDSSKLWDVIWEYRDLIGGIAHTHPWEGSTVPSCEDKTTFRAVERALGKRLVWPIVTMDHVQYFTHNDEEAQWKPSLSYVETPVDFGYRTPWLQTILKLRQLSKQGEQQW